MHSYTGPSSLSDQDIDAMLSDLDMGSPEISIAAPAAASPKKRIPEKGNQLSPIFGKSTFPFSGETKPVIGAHSLNKGKDKPCHNGRDLEKDNSAIRQLAWRNPECWVRDASDPSKRFKSRIIPADREGTSLSSPNPSKTNPSQEPNKEKKHVKPKKKTNEEHARVKPPVYEDTTPLLKGVVATMVLQKEGVDLTTLRMTPHKKLAEDIKAGTLGAKGQSPADYIRRRIVRHVENEVGRVAEGLTPEVSVCTEVSPSGAFHTHVIVNRKKTPSTTVAYFGVF